MPLDIDVTCMDREIIQRLQGLPSVQPYETSRNRVSTVRLHSLYVQLEIDHKTDDVRPTPSWNVSFTIESYVCFLIFYLEQRNLNMYL